MATIYEASFIIVSDFCSYNEEQLKAITEEIFKNYRNKENGLGLAIHDLEIKKFV